MPTFPRRKLRPRGFKQHVQGHIPVKMPSEGERGSQARGTEAEHTRASGQGSAPWGWVRGPKGPGCGTARPGETLPLCHPASRRARAELWRLLSAFTAALGTDETPGQIPPGDQWEKKGSLSQRRHREGRQAPSLPAPGGGAVSRAQTVGSACPRPLPPLLPSPHSPRRGHHDST